MMPLALPRVKCASKFEQNMFLSYPIPSHPVLAECSLSVNFEAKWYIVEALPIMLAGSIVVVVLGVRLLQWAQRTMLRRLPFGATSDTSLTDVVIGIFITGLFYLYFRTSLFELSSRLRVCIVSRFLAPALPFNHVGLD